MKVVNPATEETIQTLSCDTEASITEKFAKARAAQALWAGRTVEERVAIIAKFSQLLESNRDELAKTLTSEVGKPLQQSINEVNGARTRIGFFVEQSAKHLATETVFEAPGRVERIAYEPLGLAGVISAWNYPYLVGVNAVIPALIAGNAVIYKPSEFSTLTGLRIAALLHEAGVPKEVFATIVGDGSQGSALTSLHLDGVFFTGSVGTGRRIRKAVADRFIASGFELGGKDPVYVCEDVDVEKVAPAIADGVFYNNGQSCCSVERIYVREAIFDKFVDRFVAEVKSFKMGSPTENGVYLGPLTRSAQRETIQSQVDDAVKKGAKLLTGGKAAKGPGYYYEPTVLVNVNHAMTVMKEESFGPVIGIQKVANDDEAIRMMNDSTYGLTAGVYTPNAKRAHDLLARVNAGSAYWNCCDRVSPYLPWSGRQDSGLGSTLSHLGIRAFTKPKAYHLIS
ncbi:MAG: aldehyde dehydrogenase family protein [Deltaproteobacteria bacterium]|nr:aldehyde dehydrogenase family protein [Deltaproteobacteria bacterium]